MSREITTFASLAAAVIVWGIQASSITPRLLPDMVVFLSRAGDRDGWNSTRLWAISFPVAEIIFPGLLAAFLAGSGAVLLQTRFLVNGGALQPKLSRVSPKSGLSRIFGLNGFVEIVKSLTKLVFLTAVIWMALRRDWDRLAYLLMQDSNRLLKEFTIPLRHLFFSVISAHAIIGFSDLLWVRFRHSRDMRMSKQDIRDELKDTEGHPHIKARIRGLQLTRARKRMMAKVPSATVVITNPTHYAVALSYDRTHSSAPRIVAKGYDSVAARIREIASINNVPIVSNPPLARALYTFDLDSEIPPEYYRAVAEIIAYLWRLRRTAQSRP